ncbi:hypothetical protein, partial [Runella sp.]|uniref:hypothetical protein n=2 Tax=Runella sp. TaxID=1960881 RepID=UPI00301A2402
HFLEFYNYLFQLVMSLSIIVKMNSEMNGTKVQELILLTNFLSVKRRNKSVKRSKLQLKETQNPLQLLETGFFSTLIYQLIFY